MSPPLTFRERVLYHQIHPLKLAVDIGSSAVSTWLLWRHDLWLALPIAILPSVAVTLPMVRWLDFTAQRDSALGRYLAFHMTRAAELVRLSGQAIIWIGGWQHDGWLIAAGIAVVVLGWTYSLPSWRRRQKALQSGARVG